MTATADSPSSPTVPGGGGGESNSPQLRRKNLPSPWAKVVRGESESISAVHQSSSSASTRASQPEQPPFSDSSSPKTASTSPPPENASASEGSDGNSGNAARPKKLAWNKPSNGVVDVGPVMGAVSWPALSESTKASPKSPADSASKTVIDSLVSSSQGTITPHSPQKQATTNANSNYTSNHTMPARQRSMKRGGGGNTRGGPAQGDFTYPPPPPPPPPFTVFPLPPPPNARAFVTPQPGRPFAGPMGFPELYYISTMAVETFRPFLTHTPPPAVFIPLEPPLPTLIVNQIDYYFSDANLVKDDFLRSNMDSQGWVPITLIASFPRVKTLTANIQLILDSLRASTVLEVQEDRVRRRNEWKKWILASALLPSDSSTDLYQLLFRNHNGGSGYISK